MLFRGSLIRWTAVITWSALTWLLAFQSNEVSLGPKWLETAAEDMLWYQEREKVLQRDNKKVFATKWLELLSMTWWMSSRPPDSQYPPKLHTNTVHALVLQKQILNLHTKCMFAHTDTDEPNLFCYCTTDTVTSTWPEASSVVGGGRTWVNIYCLCLISAHPQHPSLSIPVNKHYCSCWRLTMGPSVILEPRCVQFTRQTQKLDSLLRRND